MLNLRVGISLDSLLDLETYQPQVALHLVPTKKEKINANLVAPPLVQVNRVATDVESQEQ